MKRSSNWLDVFFDHPQTCPKCGKRQYCIQSQALSMNRPPKHIIDLCMDPECVDHCHCYILVPWSEVLPGTPAGATEQEIPVIPTQYKKKSPVFEARQLTEDNFNEIADWCHGRIETYTEFGNSSVVEKFLRVPQGSNSTTSPLLVWVGGWVVKSNNVNVGYDIFTNETFRANYEENN